MPIVLLTRQGGRIETGSYRLTIDCGWRVGDTIRELRWVSFSCSKRALYRARACYNCIGVAAPKKVDLAYKKGKVKGLLIVLVRGRVESCGFAK